MRMLFRLEIMEERNLSKSENWVCIQLCQVQDFGVNKKKTYEYEYNGMVMATKENGSVIIALNVFFCL